MTHQLQTPPLPSTSTSTSASARRPDRLPRRHAWRASTLAAMLAVTPAANGADWPSWRGAKHDGVAPAGAPQPPLHFSAERNVRWSVDVPGRGHGSACVVGTSVFLAAADEDEQVQWLLCFDRGSGERRWAREVHRGGLGAKLNRKASHASSTPACDGERVFVNFLNAGKVYTTAFSVAGERLWQAEICRYVVHQGFSTSPLLHGGLLLVSADNKAGGVVCALERETGEAVWRAERPKFPNYVSPIVLRVGGRDQLVLQGCDLVTSLDPATGATLWEHEGATTECVSSIVTDGERVFTSGGFPKNHVAAVRGDGSGEVAWENTSRVYVPSMVVRGGHLFAVMDNGNAMCWDCESGEELWRERLLRTTSASPVMAGDRLYAVDEEGNWAVVRADPERFEVLAKNRLGDEVFATPAICAGEIFIRVAEHEGGRRQERLYCIGR